MTSPIVILFFLLSFDLDTSEIPAEWICMWIKVHVLTYIYVSALLEKKSLDIRLPHRLFEHILLISF